MIEPYWKSKDGRHVVYCGDCREILPHVKNVDVIITDPPYGISHVALQGQKRTGKRVGAVNTWHPKSLWDNEIKQEWGELSSACSDVIVWFGNWKKRDQVESMISHKLRCEIIWAKDCHVGPPCPVAPRDERIWIFSKEAITPTRFETSVWDEDIIPTWSHKDHLNEKPLRLMVRLVSFFNAETICDPFMGSGTTGVACVRLNRRFIGIEISQEYCDIAVERIKRELSQPRLELEPHKSNFEQASLLPEMESANG